jgi:hypothetical protein
MLGQLRSPLWHVPMPFTGESSVGANLWREHVANRERMGRELAARGVAVNSRPETLNHKPYTLNPTP